MTTGTRTHWPDDLLRLLAEDAIETQQLAMRHGFKRPQQIERVVEAFKKRLAEPIEPGVKADPEKSDVWLDHARAT